MVVTHVKIALFVVSVVAIITISYDFKHVMRITFDLLRIVRGEAGTKRARMSSSVVSLCPINQQKFNVCSIDVICVAAELSELLKTNGHDLVVNDGPDEMPRWPIPTLKNRYQIAQLLEAEGKTVGVELGVNHGDFSQHMLSRWSSCERYVLVDLWQPRDNYKDSANHRDREHDYTSTLTKLDRWKTKVRVCRNLTSVCYRNYPDNYFDFVFVDAGHDRKSVLLDLALWWPKVESGGIMAGHDYVDANDFGGERAMKESNTFDYGLNFDGTRDSSGRITRGAVEDFFSLPQHVRQVSVTYWENTACNGLCTAKSSWLVRK